MSKLIKNRRRKKKIFGWPADKIFVYKYFNNAAFYIPDGSESKKGFTIGLEKNIYPNEVLDIKEPEHMFKLGIFRNLGNETKVKPTTQQLKSLNLWMDYKEYMRCVRKYKRHIFEKH